MPPKKNLKSEALKHYFQRFGHQIVYKYKYAFLGPTTFFRLFLQIILICLTTRAVTAIPNHAECAMRRDLDLEIELKSTSKPIKIHFNFV